MNHKRFLQKLWNLWHDLITRNPQVITQDGDGPCRLGRPGPPFGLPGADPHRPLEGSPKSEKQSEETNAKTHAIGLHESGVVEEVNRS